MLKGIFAGLVAGAIATACVLKATAGHEADPAPGPGGGTAAASTDVAAMKKELEALKADGEALQKKIDGSKAELASLEHKAPGKKARKKAASKTWKDLAPLMAKAFGMRRGEDGKDVDEETKKKLQMMEIELMGILAKIAQDRGISIDEAMGAPEGLPALLRELLESGTPPGTPEQLAKMDALVAKYTDDWAKLNASDEGTKLERRLAKSDLSHAFSDAYRDIQTEEQREASKQNFGDMFGDGMGRDNQWLNGTKESIAADLAKQWGDSLKLTESQRGELGPYVAEFMRQHEELQKKRHEEGDKYDWRAAQFAAAKLQVVAQKAIAAGMSLTDEQKKAMHDWGTVYDFWIQAQVNPEPKPESPQEVPAEPE